MGLHREVWRGGDPLYGDLSVTNLDTHKQNKYSTPR